MTDLMRITTEFTGVTGSPYFSTQYCSTVGGLVAVDAVAGVHALWHGLRSIIKSDLSWTVLGVVDVVDSTTGHVTGIQTTSPTSDAGTLTDPAMPTQVQGLIEWGTGHFINHRQLKGKTYIPRLCTTVAVNGVPSSSTLTTINSAAATYAAGGSFTPVIFSKKHLDFWPIQAGSAWTLFATLRSRRD